MIFPFLLNPQSSVQNSKRKSLLKLLKLVFLLLIFITACEEIPNSTIEQKIINFKAESINAPQEFFYSIADSTFITTIKFSDNESIEKVWLSVRSIDGSSTIIPQIFMSDNGDYYFSGDQTAKDKIYSAIVQMSKNYPSGKYIIEYYVQNSFTYSSENTSKYGSHIFTFSNTQKNLPPSIVEVTLPNSVTFEQRFTIMVKVSDPNGLNDIAAVYYELYKPDGSKAVNSQGISEFPLFDNGFTSYNGDLVANDGIYSVFLTFPSGQSVGQWRFEFTAMDRSGLKSDKSIHFITLN